MDLGCLDLGCVSVSDKHGTEVFAAKSDSRDDNVREAAKASFRIGKNKLLKEPGQSTSNTLNKFTSQIKKPSHRKSSPLNWFPRKKVDSYLKRKIKTLQEVGGMNLTLDETLGDSNPHYSKVLIEKMAAREAAHKAMEARKAALVEASWCRILRAARIQSTEAEAQLFKAEISAAEAFEAATAIGVIMYDMPNCPRKPYQIETSAVKGVGSTTHKVTASFETAFEVDKEVAAAVKTALIRLANCATFNRDEFEELLRKISQNPDSGENNQELSEFSSECESESGSELENASHKDGFCSQDIDCKLPVPELRHRKNRKKLSFERLNFKKLVEMMLERLGCLQEDELSSLATIVATCGLNAALADVQTSKLHDPDSSDYSSTAALNFPQRISTMEDGNHESFLNVHSRRKQVESELPSLDKFLIKHVTKLEREVWEAKSSRKNESEGEKNGDKNDRNSSEVVPDLGDILIKHCSKLEQEIEEAKRNNGKTFGMNGKRSKGVPKGGFGHTNQDVPEVPSLEKVLVKHVSRLEKEVQEAKNRRNNEPDKGDRVISVKTKVDSSSLHAELEEIVYSDGGIEEKENIDSNNVAPTISEIDKEEFGVGTGEPSLQIGQMNLNAAELLSVHAKKTQTKEFDDGLDKILLKPVHRLERDKLQAVELGRNYVNQCQFKKQDGNTSTNCESLDKILVKHVSRLEKEKMRFSSKDEVGKETETKMHSQMNQQGGLAQILVKHESRLEREKIVATQHPDDRVRPSVTRREARERELQEAWGGLSLGNSMKPRLSKLERDKAAWIKAEEEERKKATKDM
ncbi:hypothetical protein CJ030_MR7G022656 [Morella rubra]|uniref:Uncharacterized protein n=1 Tax=Morella rubra TaxID=262757 RepID=A0A6A1V8I0_9ROSI|nr:hypothetical protein CJ030_MR7G022656 [Morella rubra]